MERTVEIRLSFLFYIIFIKKLYICSSITAMKENFKQRIDYLKPYQGIIYFLVVLFISHFLWKWAVKGNLHGHEISIFGIDYSGLFYKLSKLINDAVYYFSSWFPGTKTLRKTDTLIYFYDGGQKLRIIWGCTGVKQLYTFIIIMLLYHGSWKEKIWYIPLGCIILWVYNIIRISGILFLTKNHPERFDFLHEGITKYIYYALIFLLWLIWEEKIRKKNIR